MTSYITCNKRDLLISRDSYLGNYAFVSLFAFFCIIGDVMHLPNCISVTKNAQYIRYLLNWINQKQNFSHLVSVLRGITCSSVREIFERNGEQCSNRSHKIIEIRKREVLLTNIIT